MIPRSPPRCPPARNLRASLLAYGFVFGASFGACRTEPARTPAAIVPTPLYRFEGVVRLKNGSALAYAAILTPDPAAPGAYLGTVDVPRQTLAGADLRVLRFVPGQRVEFELPVEGGPRWIGDYNADGTLECSFSQGDVVLPCSMQRVLERPAAVSAPRHRPQTPLPPFPYTTVDVKYENAAAHAMLLGTLTLPTGAGPHPAALLVAERGLDRDATRFGHKPLAVLADALTRQGITVLRADDREMGQLDLEAQSDPRDREGDLSAGLAFLESRTDIDPARVGLVGYGAGSELAGRAAGAEGAAFLILLGPNALDPASERGSPFAGVRCPVLALSGALDGEVDAERNGAALRRALQGARASVEVVPGANHLLQPAETGDPADYEAIEATLAPPALRRISTWLGTTLQR